MWGQERGVAITTAAPSSNSKLSKKGLNLLFFSNTQAKLWLEEESLGQWQREARGEEQPWMLSISQSPRKVNQQVFYIYISILGTVESSVVFID